MKRFLAASLALMFYASILPWSVDAAPQGRFSVLQVDNVLKGEGVPYVDVRAHSTLALALTAAANKTLLVSSTVTISDNTTIPDTVAVLVLRGGSFAVDNNMVLTINSPFSAGRYQVFSGAGTVIFGLNSINAAFPEWWGGGGNGTAINKAVQSLGVYGITSKHFPPILFGAGWYTIDVPIVGSVGRAGAEFEGAGPNATYWNVSNLLGGDVLTYTTDNALQVGSWGGIKGINIQLPDYSYATNIIKYYNWGHATSSKFRTEGGLGSGVHITNGIKIDLSDYNIVNPGISGLVVADALGSGSTTVRSEGGYISGAGESGMDISCIGFNSKGDIIESSAAEGVRFRGGVGTFDGTYFESNQWDDIIVGYDNTQPGYGTSVTLINPWFQRLDYPKASGKGAVYALRGNTHIVGGNWYFYEFATYPSVQVGAATLAKLTFDGPKDISPAIQYDAGEVYGGYAGPNQVPAYSDNVQINAYLGEQFTITPTDNAAFSIANPVLPTLGKRITIRIKNTSGAALGTATFDTLYKMTSWTQPATGYSRTIDFRYDGTNWIEVGRAAADIPN